MKRQTRTFLDASRWFEHMHRVVDGVEEPATSIAHTKTTTRSRQSKPKTYIPGIEKSLPKGDRD